MHVRILTWAHEKLWTLSAIGNFYRIDSSLVPRILIPHEIITASGVTKSYDHIVDHNQRIWFGSPLCRIDPPYTTTQNIQLGMKRIVQVDRETIAVGVSQGFSLINPTGQRIVSSDTLEYSGAVLALFSDQNGILWIGSDKGLHQFDGSRITPFTIKGITFSVNCITDDWSGNLLIGSNECGVMIMHEGGHIQIDKSKGLYSNQINALYVEKEKRRIWVVHSASHGIDCIAFTDSSLSNFRITHYSTAHGLPSNHITDIAGFAGKIWLATSEDLCHFNPDALIRDTNPPYINLTGFAVNNHRRTLGDVHSLNHDENDIFISYAGIRFGVDKDIQYRYRILGLEDEWTTTVNRSQYFFSVPPGEYVFQVAAMNEHGIWNPVPAELHFTINPHFTQTLWFWISVGCLVLLAIGLIIRRVFVNQQIRYTTEAQIQELRTKLLGANMNPHFTFNVLNSIQSFINQKDLTRANEFLARFSHLIRINLESSQESIVSMEQELDRLELYLSLEQMRFGKGLQYSITVDPNIDLDETTCPTMLVQPYVENAIWHGILPQKSGRVEIIIAPLNTESYTITVRDNGVGLTTRKSKTQHRPLSMKLNHERLTLLSKSQKQHFSVETYDRKEAGEESSGTVVRITLPLEPRE